MRIKFLLLLLAVSHLCIAQQVKQGTVGNMVNYVLSKNLNREALMQSAKGKAYFFTVTLLFDGQGKVDTAFFSKNLDRDTKAVMGLNSSLIKKIKEQGVIYKSYTLKAVIIPIYFYRRSDTGIDYSSGFIDAIENLLPAENSHLLNRSMVVVDPVINPFVRIEN